METDLLPQPPAPEHAHGHSPSSGCTNCGFEKTDVYCARCGERQPDHHDYAVSHFLHHAFHELVHLDSKLITTLRLLITRPGLLTVEYFAGRKQRYIAPLRLFLTLFALHLIAYTAYKPVAMYSMEGLSRAAGDSKPVDLLVNKVAKKKNLPPDIARERINDKMHKSMSLLQLFNILLLAIVLKVLFWRRYFVEHLVFSAHYLSFTYLFSLVWWPFYLVWGLRAVQKPGVVISIAIMIWYTYKGTRLFYQQSKVRTAWKTVLIWLGYYLVQMLMLFVPLMIAVMLIIKS